jgi:uncharacterized membrane protein YbhN (UPF0104 family)
MKLWIKTAVSLGILLILLLILPWSEVVDSIRLLPFIVWLLVLTGFLIGHVIGALKWTLILRGFGCRLPWTSGLRCYAAGLFANLCLPGIVGGDVVRATLAIRQSGRAEAVVLGSTADRAIDTFALVLLLAGGAAVAGVRVADPNLGWLLLLTTAGILGGGLAGFLLLRRSLKAWPARLRRIVGRTLVALRHLRRSPAIPLSAFLLALSIQGLFVLLNAYIGGALAIDVPTSVWFLVWPLAKLAGVLPVSLGGLGVRDVTLGALLTGFGVPAARGVVASLIWQSILIAGGLLAGMFWWTGSRRTPLSTLRNHA